MQPVKRSYRKGDSAQIISEIKSRLFLFGDMADKSSSMIFDSVLENGVKNFQRRFGLKEDGVIGSEIIRELNIPLQKRVQQIIVNMERSRWLPDAVQGPGFCRTLLPFHSM